MISQETFTFEHATIITRRRVIRVHVRARSLVKDKRPRSKTHKNVSRHLSRGYVKSSTRCSIRIDRRFIGLRKRQRYFLFPQTISRDGK